MRRNPIVGALLTGLFILGGSGWAEERVPMENGPLRLSAIVSAGTRYYAGFVGAEDGAAYLVPEGGKVLNWRLTEIDEAAMTALLVDADGDEMFLALTGDEALAASTQPEAQAPGIKTLEQFLAEHPELAAQATPPAEFTFPEPTNNTPVTFEDFLASHPEMAGLTNYVAPELRAGVTGTPATLSAADVPDQPPVSREEGLRRMAEQTGMPVPEDKETTYEDFLRLHAPKAMESAPQ